MTSTTHPLSDSILAQWQARGYLVVPGLADERCCRHLRQQATNSLCPLRGPAEFEVDTGYPGAPVDPLAEGADTPRRLLFAYSRDTGLRDWATGAEVGRHLRQLMQRDDIALSQTHHNCIMTKHPGYSSRTGWHQDIRYWSFDRPELVSVWLALGSETTANGALQVIPGSHLLNLGRGRLDKDLFLRQDLAENRALLEQAESVDLEAGDVLFFHSRLLHAAGMNRTDDVKISLVFTYHDAGNRAIPGTRSAKYPSIRF